MEKRWYNRYSVTAPGVVAEGRIIKKVELLDLSAQGARIVGDLERIKEGDEILLCISFKPPIKVKGQVRWRRKTGKGVEAGIQFTEVDFKTRQHLQVLLSQVALSKLPDSYLR